MIIDNNNNFIFVHVYRTGGSSIDRAFGGTTNRMNTHTKLEDVPGWENYFSFGVIRNPWDRLVSSYKYLTIRKQFEGTFEEYVQQFAEGKLSTTKKYAQYDMVKNCSYIMRFEHLQEDFEDVCKIIGIPAPNLPHAWKTEHKPYTQMYNEQQKQIIAEASSGDIEHYGFTFDSTATKNIGKIK